MAIDLLGGIIKGIGAFDPFTKAIDLVGDAIGLPAEVKGAAKMAVGAMTGNIIMVTEGARELAEAHGAHECAKTEVAPSDELDVRTKGYASATAFPLIENPPFDEGLISNIDSNLGAYRDVLAMLLGNWATFDTAVGARDDRIAKQNLTAIRDNPVASAELRRTAQFLLDHPEYLNRLSTLGKTKGNIDKKAVEKELASVEAQLGGAPKSSEPVKGNTKKESAYSIVTDPSLSIEEKVQLILDQVVDNLDGAILGVMSELDALSRKDAEGAKDAEAVRSMEKLQLKLQKLVERRKQMFDLTSTMASKHHEMAKTALQNMARA